MFGYDASGNRTSTKHNSDAPTSFTFDKADQYHGSPQAGGGNVYTNRGNLAMRLFWRRRDVLAFMADPAMVG